MTKHGNTDDGKQARGQFGTFDSPLNVKDGGPDTPPNDNQVPTAPSRDPLGLIPSGGSKKEIGPKG